MKAVTEEASECLANAFTDVLSHVFVISNNTDSSQREERIMQTINVSEISDQFIREIMTGEHYISIMEIIPSGDTISKTLTKDELIESLQDHKLPLRDLRMLLKTSTSLRAKYPALLPRPSSKCFIFDIENIRLLCFSDHCIIFNPEDHATQRFIKCLKEQFRLKQILATKDGYGSQISMKTLYIASNIGNMCNQDFEFVILETALEFIVKKFKRHMKIKRPALEMLLQQIEHHPETTGLKRLLAVKKSLLEFEQRVEHVVRAVQQLLSDNEVTNMLLTFNASLHMSVFFVGFNRFLLDQA